jgi:hypothetical protein
VLYSVSININSQYHFSILKAKPTISIRTENIEKDFSIPNTALVSGAENKEMIIDGA